MFPPKPKISFISARKWSSYFARIKVYPTERTVGSFKYTKKCCEVCEIVDITDSFPSPVTQNTYKINHKRNCDDKCLIYLFTYKQCLKQFVGETADALRRRWNNYKNNTRKFLRGGSCMQQHLFEHFQTRGHTGFVEDVCITFIDKADPFIPTKREDY